MEVLKIKPGKSTDNRVTTDEARKKRATGRRRQDTVIPMSPDQKIKLDRRAMNSDRRISNDPNYNGPSRRYTIDRRQGLKERRDKR